MKSNRRVFWLGFFVVLLGGLTLLVVPELDLLFHGKPESLENTNTLVAATAAQALVKFKAERIIPALEKAAQRKDNVSGYAKGALRQLESQAAANPGVPK